MVGNVLKDVYLRMDERSEHFERDGQGVSWLDLGFDGSTHKFFHRTSLFGGAAVSLEVLRNLEIEVEMMGAPEGGDDFEQMRALEYRYILTRGDEVSYFVASARPATSWMAPQEEPNWILVDRSTVASDKLVAKLEEYLAEHPQTKLAIHANKDGSRAALKLTQMADILFTEEWFKASGKAKKGQLVCHLGAEEISLGSSSEKWSLDRVDLATHLTVFSTMAATVLGVMANGGVARDALLYARINAEESTLDRTLSLENLRERAKEELAKRF